MSNETFKIKNGLTLTPVDLASLTNPQAGDLACDINDSNKIKRYDANAADWVEVGSGAGGGLDVFYSESFNELSDTSGFIQGASPDPFPNFVISDGTLNGTLELEDVQPISSTKSLKYTQASGSLNDYFASELIDLDPKQQNNTIGMTFYFTYNGSDNDGQFVIYDITNSRIISSEQSLVKNTGTKATRYSLSFFVPSNCTQIRWGYRILAENIGAELKIDDVEMSTNPFVVVTQDNITEWKNYTPTFLGLGTPTNVDVKYRKVGGSVEISGRFSSGTPTASEIRIGLPEGLSVLTSIANFTVGRGSRLAGAFAYEKDFNMLAAGGHTYLGMAPTSDSRDPNVRLTGTGMPISANNGIFFFASVPIEGLTATTTSILTPSDTFSTDTAPLTYANAATYTLSTLANAPIGTYITFTYAINTNTRSQTTGTNRPTQTDASMNQNGIQIFTRAYNAASTAGNPAAFAIQIGKGLKGTQLNLYKSATKEIAGTLGRYVVSSISARGVFSQDYNEKTGILVIDAGTQISSNTTADLDFSDGTVQTNGYLTINASRSLPLLAVPVPLTAYLKDVKPSGTAGGTFTSGAWQTRTLNTVEGDGSIVSLSGSQFQLGPGKYEIEASAPGYAVTRHQIKLFNISTSSDVTLGNLGRSADISSQTLSLLFTNATLSSTTVFEIQHRCETTRLTDGFGNASIIGSDTAFTQVKITKVG